ncbi:MAG: hypothetical protein R3F19_20115 [Verrucomicrobiales bacterium]
MRIFTILCFLVISTIATGIGWLHATEHFASTVATAIGAVIAVAVIALWMVCQFGGSAKSKIVTVIAGALAIGGSTQLFRYNGSFDGSSLPQFTWRWAPVKGEGLDDLSNLQSGAPADQWTPPGIYQDFPGYLERIAPAPSLDSRWKPTGKNIRRKNSGESKWDWAGPVLR